MTAHIFMGPSGRALETAAMPSGIEWHGPVQHGDLLRLRLERGDVVGIIDGLFYDRPALRPKEILVVAGLGVKIIGGASMGALRAADLAGHGVDGVGQVFSWIMSGVVTADHEVAMLHSDADNGYRPITLALVSVRDALSRVRRAGWISTTQSEQVLGILGDLYFADRTEAALRTACDAAGVPSPVYGTIRDAVQGPTDVKVRDAVEVIAAVASSSHNGAFDLGTIGGAGVEATDNWELWIRELSLQDASTTTLAKARAVQAVQLFSGTAPELYAKAVQLALAAEWGTSSNPDCIAQEFRSRSGLKVVTAQLAAHWLYPPTSDSASNEDLCRLAVATYRVNPSLPAWAALSAYLVDHYEFSTVIDRLATASMRSKGMADGGARLEPRVVFTWLGQLWRCPSDPDILRRVGYSRGFRDLDDVFRTAVRFLSNNLGASTISPILSGLR